MRILQPGRESAGGQAGKIKAYRDVNCTEKMKGE